MMSYEKLDVYQCSIQFLAIATELVTEMPRGSKDLSDQIKRAAMSIPLNIAEGAGKRTKPDCRKYFDNARGSAMECGAAMDVCRVLKFADEKEPRMRKSCCTGLSPCSQNFLAHSRPHSGIRLAPRAHDAAYEIVFAHVDENANVGVDVSH